MELLSGRINLKKSVLSVWKLNRSMMLEYRTVYGGREKSMRVLFCNIAWMKFYKGNYPNIDEPENGGEYVKQFKDAAEVYNFQPCSFDDEETCLGFVETKSTNGKDPNQMHIEKISGVDSIDEVIDDVLVIWCAKQVGYENRTVVVGWYKQAQVYRNYQVCEWEDDDGEAFEKYFNVRSKAENCVLLPANERNRAQWSVPRKRPKGPVDGFGRANVWYGRDDKAKDYISKLVETISSYDGENWLRKELF